MDTSIYRCPNCKANLLFNPKSQNWNCDYCGGMFTFTDLQRANENSEFKQPSSDYKPPEFTITTDDTPEISQNLDVYRCSACGAEMVADENTTSTFCVYCGNSSILKSKLNEQFRPKYIIPFKQTKEDAIAAYKSYKHGKWFAPKEFGDEKIIEKLSGVYIPFWLYDGVTRARTSYTGERNYKSYRRGDYIITEVDLYQMEREGNMAFSKVPCDGSKKFDDDLMDTIEPFDYKELKEFNMSYLSGFLSEKYDVSSEENTQRAKDRMANSTYSKLRSTVSGYSAVVEKTCHSITSFDDIAYALFPVWMLNIKYKDKIHTFAMNGQTGKMSGDIPVDTKKMYKTALLIFLASFGLFAAIAQLYFM